MKVEQRFLFLGGLALSLGLAVDIVSPQSGVVFVIIYTVRPDIVARMFLRYLLWNPS